MNDTVKHRNEAVKAKWKEGVTASITTRSDREKNHINRNKNAGRKDKDDGKAGQTNGISPENKNCNILPPPSDKESFETHLGRPKPRGHDGNEGKGRGEHEEKGGRTRSQSTPYEKDVKRQKHSPTASYLSNESRMAKGEKGREEKGREEKGRIRSVPCREARTDSQAFFKQPNNGTTRINRNFSNTHRNDTQTEAQVSNVVSPSHSDYPYYPSQPRVTNPNCNDYRNACSTQSPSVIKSNTRTSNYKDDRGGRPQQYVTNEVEQYGGYRQWNNNQERTKIVSRNNDNTVASSKNKLSGPSFRLFDKAMNDAQNRKPNTRHNTRHNTRYKDDNCYRDEDF
mmetsp:Transcript_16765/g.30370  ORF Transcript_16765/g.30370 Transcript_16765/m.30370 type:complete len:340 (-) Transcript_16765:278-1297(-)